MTFHIITIFPKIFNSYFNESMLKRAQENNKIKIKIYNLRDWTDDKHKTVDDSPYGGGAGMIMKVDILYRAIQDIKSKIAKEPGIKDQKLGGNKKAHTSFPAGRPAGSLIPRSKIVLTSAKGKTWNQQLSQEYSKLTNIIIICGRYEGVDERITNFIDEEISIGDYVLTGGEIPAMAIVDATARLLPGVLGNPASLDEESFDTKNHPQPAPAGRHAEIRNPQLEYPQYTRPEIFIDESGKEYPIPEILLSGNHKKIQEWRQSRIKTKNKS